MYSIRPEAGASACDVTDGQKHAIFGPRRLQSSGSGPLVFQITKAGPLPADGGFPEGDSHFFDTGSSSTVPLSEKPAMQFCAAGLSPQPREAASKMERL